MSVTVINTRDFLRFCEEASESVFTEDVEDEEEKGQDEVT